MVINDMIDSPMGKPFLSYLLSKEYVYVQSHLSHLIPKDQNPKLQHEIMT